MEVSYATRPRNGAGLFCRQLAERIRSWSGLSGECDAFQAFAVFCGMGISNTRVYEQAVKAMARQSIALDVLAYHTSASVEEVQRLKVYMYSIYGLRVFAFSLDSVRACELYVVNRCLVSSK